MNDKEQKFTPGEMLIAANTLYILNEDNSNRITANVQAGFVTQPRRGYGEVIRVTDEESNATAQRLAHCWNTHDELVEALEAVTKDMNEHGVLWTSTKRIVNAALAKARGEEVGE